MNKGWKLHARLEVAQEMTSANGTPSSKLSSHELLNSLNHLYFSSPSSSHMETEDDSYAEIIPKDLQKARNSLTWPPAFGKEIFPV